MILQDLRSLYHKYTKKQQKCGKKDINSMKFLIDKNLTQSQSIRLGNELENLFRDHILNQSLLRSLNRKCKNKECDHIFMDNANNTIYYAELKCNLNLDTEKSVSTYKKCQQITNELRIMYPNCDVCMYLVSLRYHRKELIPNNIQNKYRCIDTNLCGISEYLIHLGLNGFENETEYKEFINEFVELIF
jgi:hypothetical protein